MNIGIRLHDTKPGTLRERLAYAAEQGFSCVQLAMSKAVPGFRMEEAPALLTEDLAAEVKEELERAGMECAVLGCYLKLAAKAAKRIIVMHNGELCEEGESGRILNDPQHPYTRELIAAIPELPE